MCGIEFIAERDTHTLLIGVVALRRLADGIISDFLRDNTLDPVKIEYTVNHNAYGALIVGSYNILKRQICITKEKATFNKNVENPLRNLSNYAII